MTGVAGLLLAAGEGSRIGQPKALVQVGGVPLAQRGMTLLRDGGCAPVAVVLGAAQVDTPGAIAVHNPHWRSGMGSSLRAGLDALPDTAAAVVVALVDQPCILPEAVRRLVQAHEAGAAIAVASYDGRPRNPVLLSRVHWPAVASVAVGDVGARPFLRANPALVTHIECGDIADPADVDTPADLDRLGGGLP